MNTIKKIAIALAVLMVFSLAAPATATYAGDHPLVTYESGPLTDGGIVYETVEDGSAYTKLYCTFYEEELGERLGSNNLTQALTVEIPEGATVKMARLYNYVSWSTSDRDIGKYLPDYDVGPNPGMPAEADIWFNGVKKVCKLYLGDNNRDSLSNPINYNNDVIQYWDTKGQGYTVAKWDYPAGTFAWDVTDIVTGSGTYEAIIYNNDSTPTGVRPGEDINSARRERFVTYGFGLLVVYENLDNSAVTGKYWIDEGCDLLLNTSKYGIYEPLATTYAPFIEGVGGVPHVQTAGLTQVVVTSDKGNESDWLNSKNMVCFNCPTQTCPLDCSSANPGCCLGPSTAYNYKSIGVNYDDVVIDLLEPSRNFVYFQDRDLGTERGDDEVVSNAFLVVQWNTP
jgi:hypothetical protein